MFRTYTKIPKQKINLILEFGGLGDNICRMQAVRYLHDTWKYLELYVWVPDYFEELCRKFLPRKLYPRISIFPFKNKEKSLPFNQIRSDCFHHTSLKTNLIEHAFHLIVDQMVPNLFWRQHPQIYIEPDIYDKICKKYHEHMHKAYAIITPAFTSPTRSMSFEIIQAMRDYFETNGIRSIFLGKESIETSRSAQGIQAKSENLKNLKGNYTDLLNKTSLLEAFILMKNSLIVVGVDNGLIHLAACSNVPIVCGYTTVAPKYRVPIRNGIVGWKLNSVTPPPSLKCRFCQSSWNYLFGWHYTKCFYGDYKCCQKLSAYDFMSAAGELLYGKTKNSIHGA